MQYYRMRAQNFQPTLYMTLGGIVQSIALTFLLSLTYDGQAPYLPGNWGSIEAWMFWLKFGTAFLIIVLVWHEYAVGLIYFWWVWDLLDSILPFAMGTAEYVLISHIGDSTLSSWVGSMFWVSLVGSASLLNQLWKAEDGTDHEDAYRTIKLDRRKSIVSALGLTVVFAVSWLVLWQYPSWEQWRLAGVIGVFVITLGMLIFGTWTLRKLRHLAR